MHNGTYAGVNRVMFITLAAVPEYQTGYEHATSQLQVRRPTHNPSSCSVALTISNYYQLFEHKTLADN